MNHRVCEKGTSGLNAIKASNIVLVSVWYFQLGTEMGISSFHSVRRFLGSCFSRCIRKPNSTAIKTKLRSSELMWQIEQRVISFSKSNKDSYKRWSLLPRRLNCSSLSAWTSYYNREEIYHGAFTLVEDITRLCWWCPTVRTLFRVRLCIKGDSRSYKTSIWSLELALRFRSGLGELWPLVHWKGLLRGGGVWWWVDCRHD